MFSDFEQQSIIICIELIPISGYHMSASIALRRSGVGSALYSGAILLRSAGHKFAMYDALRKQVDRELVWFQDGGVQIAEQAAYAKWCLAHTLLRLDRDDNEVPSAKRALAQAQHSRYEFGEKNKRPTATDESTSQRLQHKQKTDTLQTLNMNWLEPRLGHRCRIVVRFGVRGWCCSSRCPWSWTVK